MFRYIVLVTVVVFIFIVSCTNQHVENKITEPNKDSINQILDSINATEKAEKLHAFFETLAIEKNFNGNVLVAQHGQIIYKESFGYSNIQLKDSLNENSAFQLASVSKQFTAVGILILKERNLLNLDDSIQRFFPNFPYKDITVRLLLSHRSGLPNYIYLFDEQYKNYPDAIYNNDSVINFLTNKQPPRYYPPDKKFNYSNTGYVILASIIEKISGKSYVNFIQDEIFKPLGMNNSFVYQKGVTNIKSNAVTGYRSKNIKAEDTYLNAIVGDKGIYSTTTDLYKWDQGLYSGKIIKYETLKEAFEPANPEMKAPRNYGFGWRTYELSDGNQMLYHRGWWYGFQNLLIRLEKDQSTIVILRNWKTKNVINHYLLLNILYPERNYLSNTNELSVDSCMSDTSSF